MIRRPDILILLIGALTIFSACRSGKPTTTAETVQTDADACDTLSVVPSEAYSSAPYSSLAFFAFKRDGEKASCTAFRVGDHYVTAAHCVFDPATLRWSTDMTICPAQFTVRGDCLIDTPKVTDVYLTRGWDIFNKPNQDFAVLKANEAPLGASTELLYDLPASSIANSKIIGFSAEPPFAMCELDSTIRILSLPLDTPYAAGKILHGMSGGPWLTPNAKGAYGTAAGITSRDFLGQLGRDAVSPRLQQAVQGSVLDCAENPKDPCHSPPNDGALQVDFKPGRQQVHSVGFEALSALRNPYQAPGPDSSYRFVLTTGSKNNVFLSVWSLRSDGQPTLVAGTNPNTQKVGPATILGRLANDRFFAFWPTAVSGESAAPPQVLSYVYQLNNTLSEGIKLRLNDTGTGAIQAAGTLGLYSESAQSITAFAYSQKGTARITAYYPDTETLFKYGTMPRTGYGESVSLAGRIISSTDLGNFVAAGTTASKGRANGLSLFAVRVPRSMDGGEIEFPVAVKDGRRAAAYPPAVVFLADSDLIATAHRNANDLNLVLSVWRYETNKTGETTFVLKSTKYYPLPNPLRLQECRTASQPQGVPCNLDLVFLRDGTLLGLNGTTIQAWHIDAYGRILDRPEVSLSPGTPFSLSFISPRRALAGFVNSDASPKIEFAFITAPLSSTVRARHVNIDCLEDGVCQKLR